MRERGTIIIILALVILVLIGFLALALGLGYVSTRKTLHQNVANLAALAAIEEFLRSSNNKNQALTRANAILGENVIPGSKRPLGDLGFITSPGDGGTLEFGTWLTEDPSPPVGAPRRSTGPCVTSHPSHRYPCFFPETIPWTPALPVNAVRVSSQYQSDNFISSPMTRIFGKDQFQLRTESIASLVPRCTVFLLDVSRSATSNSHPSGEFFAHRLLSPSLGDSSRWSVLTSTHPTRGTDSPFSGQRYADDYSPNFPILDPHPSPYGQVHVERYVDDSLYGVTRYRGPEPLNSFMLAFNAALRTLNAQITAGDGAAVIAFAGAVRGWPEPVEGLGSNFPFLIQLTNMNNRGVFSRDVAGNLTSALSPSHPNFIDRGWFPLARTGADPDSAGTHAILALRRAIDRLTGVDLNTVTTEQYCPPGAKKMIILATDGLASCLDDLTQCDKVNGGATNADNYNTYLQAKSYLLGTILNELKSEKITLTVLLDGADVGPHFINRERDEWLSISPRPVNDPANPRFFDLPEMISHPLGPDYFIDNSHSTLSDYVSRGPGHPFSDPNFLWGHMAMETGGLFCPLLNLDPNITHYIDHDGDDPDNDCTTPCNPAAPCSPCILNEDPGLGYRQPGVMQNAATSYLTPSEQAALCAQLTVGLNPFILVDEP